MLKSQIRGKWEILNEQTVRGSKDGFAIYLRDFIGRTAGTAVQSPGPRNLPLVFYIRPGHAVGATTERATGTSASEGLRRADSLGIVGSASRIAWHRKHAGLACGWRETNARDVDLWRTDTVEP